MRRAFSLIEVMISSTMLILGISALISGVHVATQQQEHNRKVSAALLISERRLEELLLLFPTSLLLSDGRHPELGFEVYTEAGVRVETPDEDAIARNFRLFYMVNTAAADDEPPESRLPGLIVETTIAWNESGREKLLSLRTVR